MVENSEPQFVPVDFRVVLYRFLRLTVLLAVAALVVKYTLLDTVLIQSDQMAPTLLCGDRAVFFRAPFFPVLRWIFRPRRNMPVVLSLPGTEHRRACLRIAALPGDSFSVDRGQFCLVGTDSMPAKPVATESLLPAVYSPRDFFAPFRIPQVGETLVLDSVPQRDFFMLAKMLKQERPEDQHAIRADLYIDDSLSNDYIITAFPLYRGPFGDIPDDLRFDWFFWDRLREYLSQTLEGKNIFLQFLLSENGRAVFKYTVRKAFGFFLADNWSAGYDSRYYGPIVLGSAEGRVIGVLWSAGRDESGKWFFRGNRLARIIR